MSADTSIEWCDATWNPARGCTRVSEGCRNCYAERFAARMSWGRPFAKMTTAGPRWTGVVRLIPEMLDVPLRWKKPRRIFVNSMSDLFHESLPDEDIAEVFLVMAMESRHTFQVLTKRPARMREWCSDAARRISIVKPKSRHADWVASNPLKGWPWPLPNVWLGVSVEDQATADDRIPLLLQTPAAVRFVSYEPAIGPVDFTSIRVPLAGESYQTISALHASDGLNRCGGIDQERLDWVIVGGESGPGARPFDAAWARSTVEQCKAAGVACFVKQLGRFPFDKSWTEDNAQYQEGPRLRDAKGGDPAEWPTDLRVREFPA